MADATRRQQEGGQAVRLGGWGLTWLLKGVRDIWILTEPREAKTGPENCSEPGARARPKAGLVRVLPTTAWP